MEIIGASKHIGAQRLFILVVGLWIGSLLTTGYLVAPAIFNTLTDRQVAGMVAANLVRHVAPIGRNGHRLIGRVPEGRPGLRALALFLPVVFDLAFDRPDLAGEPSAFGGAPLSGDRKSVV